MNDIARQAYSLRNPPENPRDILRYIATFPPLASQYKTQQMFSTHFVIFIFINWEWVSNPQDSTDDLLKRYPNDLENHWCVDAGFFKTNNKNLSIQFHSGCNDAKFE
jgi:hypothetical protein